MTAVLASCADCGPVKFPVTRVTLSCLDGHYAYAFRCPGCEKRTWRPCSWRIAHMLRDAGLPVLALVLDEPHEYGPPLTVEDVERFVRLMKVAV